MSQNKFVGVRFESFKHSQSKGKTSAIGLIMHDFRKLPPKEISTDQYHNQFENVVWSWQGKGTFRRMKKEDLTKDKINNFTKSHLAQYHEMREEHARAYKEREGRKIKDYRTSSLLSGIVYFSNTLGDDIRDGKFTKEEFEDKAFQLMKEIERDLKEKGGGEMLYATIHYDERTPHLSFATKNYDKRGMTIFNKMKTKETLSRYQDMAGKYYQELGYVRGIKKDTTGKNHQSTRQFRENAEREAIKKAQELKKLDSMVQVFENEAQQLEERNDSLKLKGDVKIQETNQKIKNKMQTYRQLKRQAEQELQTISNKKKVLIEKSSGSLKKKAETEAERIMSENVGLMGVDKKGLKENITKTLERAYQYDTVSKIEEKAKSFDRMEPQHKKLQKNAKELDDAWDKEKKEHEKTKEELKEVKWENGTLTEKINQREQENVKLEKDYKELLYKYEPNSALATMYKAFDKGEEEVKREAERKAQEEELKCKKCGANPCCCETSGHGHGHIHDR